MVRAPGCYLEAVRRLVALGPRKNRRFASSMLSFARNNGIAESSHSIMIMLQTSHVAEPLSCAGVSDTS
jgi:hypothetical protein